MGQDILTTGQQAILLSARRNQAITHKFYLTGGTANEQLVYFIHLSNEVVKIDFSYYPFEHVGSFTMDADLRVASVRDIGVNKLQAIMTRERGRDYVDLYEIIHSGKIRLEDLTHDYRIKFDMHVAPEEWAKHFAKVLDAVDQPRFLGNRTWADVEGYFLTQAKQFASQVIKVV